MKTPIIVAAFALACVQGEAMAYEITTHALITDRAYQVSTLNPEAVDSIVPALGFDRLAIDQPFAFRGEVNTTSYFDEVAVANPSDNLPPPASTSRYPQDQERNILNNLIARDLVPGTSGAAIEQKIDSWLMRGAVREDDNDIHIVFWWNLDDRENDPYGYLFRAFRHFYDPFLGRAADDQSFCGFYGCVASPTWALGRTDPLHPMVDADDTSRRNHFTWQDARNNYWWALTLKRGTTGVISADALVSSQERLDRWATTINDLGHVIHLLQDTAQPQHVRNDLHGPPITTFFDRSTAADGAFEAFTEYRVIGDRDAAIGFHWGAGSPLRHMVETNLPLESSLPTLQLGESNYYPGAGGRIQFTTPVKFFTTRHIEEGTAVATLRDRRGLADLSNRSFFTAGTLPDFHECQPVGSLGCTPTVNPTYPLPPNDLTDMDYTEATKPSGLRVNGRVVFLSEMAYPIQDRVSPNYDQALHTLDGYDGKAPLVTKGQWFYLIPDDLKPQYLNATAYTISYNNMRYMADVMVPRAVGYSAGMIDFFFRGRIKVEPPQDGLFAATDQGIEHTVDADGYTHCTQSIAPPIAGEPPLCTANAPFGFTKLRLKLRNDTAAIVESGTGTTTPQSMSTTVATPGAGDARLVAVARYHRNPCYQPSLAGEVVVDYAGVVTPPTCANGNRTAYQEISVSKPAAVSATDLNGANSAPVTFDFGDDPIPINATDLFVQVVYRGPLGEESDGIAVGIYDLREPSYLTLWNNSDYAGCSGHFYQNPLPCSFNPTTSVRVIGTARLCIGTQVLYLRQPPVPTLGYPKYVRLAALLDDQPHTTRGRLLVGTANTLQIINKSITGQVRQADMEVLGPSASYAPDPFYKKRGIIGSFRPMPFYIFSGTDPQPSTDAGPDDIGALTAAFNPSATAEPGGSLSFPNAAPAPNSSCTSGSAPYFQDEIDAANNDG
jgi:hypothetical protein